MAAAIPPCGEFLSNPEVQGINVPAGVPPHPGCSAARAFCSYASHVHRAPPKPPLPALPNPDLYPYTICDECRDQGTRILALRQPAPAAANVNTTNYQKMNEVGPTMNGNQAVVPVRHWQTPAEFANGRVVKRANETRFANFLTRLCISCEQYEQCEARYRHEAMIVPAVPPGPNYHREYDVDAQQIAGITKWDDYPFSTCTCKYFVDADHNTGTALGQPLGGSLAVANGLNYGQTQPRQCLDARRLEYDRLVKERNRNDAWLRNIERVRPNNPRSTTLKLATRAKKVRRVQCPGTWRACRCGKEIDHFDALGVQTHVPEVLQCLACQGTVNQILPYNVGAGGTVFAGGAGAALLPPAKLEAHLIRKSAFDKMRLRRKPENAGQAGLP